MPWCVLSLAENQSVEQTIFYTQPPPNTEHYKCERPMKTFISRTIKLINWSIVQTTICSMMTVIHHRQCILMTSFSIGLWQIWIFDWFCGFAWPFYQGQAGDLSSKTIVKSVPPSNFCHLGRRVLQITLGGKFQIVYTAATSYCSYK